MVCDGSDPDLGSSAGVGGHDWDTLRLYQTNITLTCPFGQAFDTNYTVELVNTCDYQSDYATQVDWTYNADNVLPSCIRKCHQLLGDKITSRGTHVRQSVTQSHRNFFQEFKEYNRSSDL